MKVVTIEHKGRTYESASDIPDDVILDIHNYMVGFLIFKFYYMLMKCRKELETKQNGECEE